MKTTTPVSAAIFCTAIAAHASSCVPADVEGEGPGGQDSETDAAVRTADFFASTVQSDPAAADAIATLDGLGCSVAIDPDDPETLYHAPETGYLDVLIFRAGCQQADHYAALYVGLDTEADVLFVAWGHATVTGAGGSEPQLQGFRGGIHVESGETSYTAYRDFVAGYRATVEERFGPILDGRATARSQAGSVDVGAAETSVAKAPPTGGDGGGQEIDPAYCPVDAGTTSCEQCYAQQTTAQSATCSPIASAVSASQSCNFFSNPGALLNPKQCALDAINTGFGLACEVLGGGEQSGPFLQDNCNAYCAGLCPEPECGADPAKDCSLDHAVRDQVENLWTGGVFDGMFGGAQIDEPLDCGAFGGPETNNPRCFAPGSCEYQGDGTFACVP